jgi:hypothetical protein
VIMANENGLLLSPGPMQLLELTHNKCIRNREKNIHFFDFVLGFLIKVKWLNGGVSHELGLRVGCTVLVVDITVRYLVVESFELLELKKSGEKSYEVSPGLVFERIESDLAIKSIRLENVSGYRYLSARLVRQPDTSSLGLLEKSLKRYSHVARSARFSVGSDPF